MEKKKVKITSLKPKVESKASPAKEKITKPVPAIVPVLAQPVFGLHMLKVPQGAHKAKKLLGRGSSSGHGKTSTRGSKGQTSRAGRHFYLGYEGGQTPLIRRIPKRGFTARRKREFQILNIRDLKRVQEKVITLDVLESSGIIKDKTKLVKVLGDGTIAVAVTLYAHSFSKQAKDKIIAAAGKIELVEEKK